MGTIRYPAYGDRVTYRTRTARPIAVSARNFRQVRASPRAFLAVIRRFWELLYSIFTGVVCCVAAGPFGWRKTAR
ncbi:hypothetical protein ANCDUO_15416 [Ancylostoma duodenale]|uniref:Uncharacterized protein n=1 Tax=Ancylostoma duodenale TaxID=51022 RepID=A0A0C2G6B3_9BILA|nr:hypothetical protein ANCDUO_15416 [Ancylostoma duodenale]